MLILYSIIEILNSSLTNSQACLIKQWNSSRIKKKWELRLSNDKNSSFWQKIDNEYDCRKYSQCITPTISWGKNCSYFTKKLKNKESLFKGELIPKQLTTN